jgi:hypothetical protein
VGVGLRPDSLVGGAGETSVPPEGFPQAARINMKVNPNDRINFNFIFPALSYVAYISYVPVNRRQGDSGGSPAWDEES